LKTSLSILALLITFAVFSQKAPTNNAAVVDSIIKEIEKIATPDEKITALNKETSKLCYGVGSLRLIKKSEEISKKANVPKLLTITYYYYNTNLDSSLYYIQKSKDLISDNELPFLRSSVLNTEGGIYVLKGDMPRALDLTLKSQAFLDKIDTTTLVGEEKLNYKKERLSLDNAIANFYNQMEEYDKASYYYDKGCKASIKDKSYISAGIFRTNKGDLFLNLEKYEEALAAFLEGKQLKKKGKAPELLLVNSDLNIGIAYTNLSRFEEGLPYLNTAISFYESTKISGNLAESLAYRGDHYLKQEKYD